MTTDPASPPDADQGGNQSNTATLENGSADTEAHPASRLLEFLVCPMTRTRLEYEPTKSELISRAARLAYPIRGGIPLLTSDTARELSDDELKN